MYKFPIHMTVFISKEQKQNTISTPSSYSYQSSLVILSRYLPPPSPPKSSSITQKTIIANRVHTNKCRRKQNKYTISTKTKTTSDKGNGVSQGSDELCKPRKGIGTRRSHRPQKPLFVGSHASSSHEPVTRWEVQTRTRKKESRNLRMGHW